MGKKYHSIQYKGEIEFCNEVKNDKKVIIDEKRKIIFFTNKNEFVNKYINKKWLKSVLECVKDNLIQKVENKINK